MIKRVQKYLLIFTVCLFSLLFYKIFHERSLIKQLTSQIVQKTYSPCLSQLKILQNNTNSVSTLLQSDNIDNPVSLYDSNLKHEDLSSLSNNEKQITLEKIDQLTQANQEIYSKLREENKRFEELEGLEEEKKEWPDEVFWGLVLGIVVMTGFIMVMSKFEWRSLYDLSVAVLLWVVFAAIAYGFIVLFKWIKIQFL